jgi:hypothetical protein
VTDSCRIAALAQLEIGTIQWLISASAMASQPFYCGSRTKYSLFVTPIEIFLGLAGQVKNASAQNREHAHPSGHYSFRPTRCRIVRASASSTGLVAVDARDRRAQRRDRGLRRAVRHDDHALDDPVGADDGLVDVPELPRRQRALDLLVELVERQDGQALHRLRHEEGLDCGDSAFNSPAPPTRPGRTPTTSPTTQVSVTDHDYSDSASNSNGRTGNKILSTLSPQSFIS